MHLSIDNINGATAIRRSRKADHSMFPFIFRHFGNVQNSDIHNSHLFIRYITTFIGSNHFKSIIRSKNNCIQCIATWCKIYAKHNSHSHIDSYRRLHHSSTEQASIKTQCKIFRGRLENLKNANTHTNIKHVYKIEWLTRRSMQHTTKQQHLDRFY